MIARQPDEPLHILVVDDEFMIATLLEDMLLSLGCKVVGTAAAVAPALALIEADDQTLDGAFLDINLRGELVYPVADALAARDVPFVFVTGYASHGIDARYAAIRTLTKPFNTATIHDVVMVFEQRRRERMNT